MAGILQKFTKSISDFANGGYETVAGFVFGSVQWPYWMLVQSVWSCVVVHRAALRDPRKLSHWLRQLLIAALMTFVPRELCALLLRMKSPVLEHPLSLVAFLATHAAIGLSPRDIVYRTLTFLHHLLSLAQAFNVIRLFRLIFRRLGSVPVRRRMTVAIGFSVMDQAIAIFGSRIFRLAATKLASTATIIITASVCIAHWVLTNRNRFSTTLGFYNERFAALIVGFVMALINSAMGMQPQPVPPPAAPSEAPESKSPHPDESEPADTREAEMPPPKATERPDKIRDNIRAFEGGYEELTAEVRKFGGTVVCCLTATWCKKAAGAIEALLSLAEKYSDVLFLIVDVDKQDTHQLARHFNLNELPHVEIMKYEGRMLKQETEAGCTPGALREMVDRWQTPP
jgi:hypothetical protein